MPPPLARRALAELLGTALLVAAVIGSGIAATRLSPGDAGLQLLENSVVTGAALVALILALQPVSAAFNPLVSLVGLRCRHDQRGDGADSRVAARRCAGRSGRQSHARVIRGELVNAAPRRRRCAARRGDRQPGPAGVIFGTARSGRSDRVAVAVGGYILAAYWFTSSTSFANPAVTIARMFSNTFAGIAPASVPAFVAMQLAGAAVSLLIIRSVYPRPARLAGQVAAGNREDRHA